MPQGSLATESQFLRAVAPWLQVRFWGLRGYNTPPLQDFPLTGDIPTKAAETWHLSGRGPQGFICLRVYLEVSPACVSRACVLGPAGAGSADLPPGWAVELNVSVL